MYIDKRCPRLTHWSGELILDKNKRFFSLFHPHFLFAPPLSDRSEFEYLRAIRYLKKEERSILQQKMEALAPFKQTKEEQLIKALENQDWTHPIFQDDYCLYALTAFQTGGVTRAQLMTLALYWTAMNSESLKAHSSLKIIPLFTTQGEPNREALELIGQSKVKDEFDFSETEKLTLLFDRMKNVPLSEQQVFIYEAEGEENSEMIKRLLSLGFNLFIEAFLETEKGKTRCRLVPTLSLMQETLSVIFQEQAVEIDTVLGIFPVKQLVKNPIDGQRSMSLPFPFISPLPKKADDLEAPGVDFVIHDFYHAYLASSVPSSKRFAFARAIHVLDSREEKTEEEKKYIHALKDLEILMYRKKVKTLLSTHQVSSSEQFWLELFIQNYLSKKETSGSGSYFEGSYFESIPVVMDYFQHQEEWVREFDICIQPETKTRVLDIFERMVNEIKKEKIESQAKALRLWTLIESASEIQTLIQEEKLEEARKKIEKDLMTHHRQSHFYKSSNKYTISEPEHAYFFGGFNDPEAFKTMIQILPEDVLPIHLSNCRVVNDEVFEEVFKCLKKYGDHPQHNYYYDKDLVDLSGCYRLTSRAVQLLSTRYVQFNFSGCPLLLKGLSFLPVKTKKILLNHIKGLKDEDLIHLTHCVELESIYLEDNPGLTDKGLEILCRCAKLQEVMLSGCHSITSKGIEKLMELELLAAIEVKRCRHLKPDTLSPLLENAKMKNLAKKKYDQLEIIF